jgi:hypothetical protein
MDPLLHLGRSLNGEPCGGRALILEVVGVAFQIVGECVSLPEGAEFANQVPVVEIGRPKGGVRHRVESGVLDLDVVRDEVVAVGFHLLPVLRPRSAVDSQEGQHVSAEACLLAGWDQRLPETAP